MKNILITFGIILHLQLTAQNYHYAVDSPKKITTAPSEEAPDEEDLAVIILPVDFNWQTIPEEYQNTIWQIEHDFDLAGQTIALPPKVTMRFKGGSLLNGEVHGNQTQIEANGDRHIFKEVDITGDFLTEYIKPQWFGAAMNGSTDDREAFVETLLQAQNIGAKVLVDSNMLLDLEETGQKSIFLEDNTWLEGANNASIIINNLLSPAFYMALTKNITIKNLTFLYDQKYDAAFGWSDNDNLYNARQLKEYLIGKKNIGFTASNPISRSPTSYRAIFLLEAAQNINFEDVKLMSKGQTADRFIQMGIKLKEQYKKNQEIRNDNGITDIPRNINLKNVTFDGIIMGIQGVVDTFTSEGLKSYRYSDIQSADGKNIGGNVGGVFWMPPPHLIYLNNDNSPTYHSEDITLKNSIDYGEYVGSENVRSSVSGYCNSLKLVDFQDGVLVDGYESYRRDGFADLGNVNNGVFKNIYVESTSSIFNPDYKFVCLRFLDNLNKVSFENVTIKDMADVVDQYPMDQTFGDYVTMDNVQIYVNEFKGELDGPFSIFGSNNKVVNSAVHIEKHSATKDFLGVVALDSDTRAKGSNNYYDVQVDGWRPFDGTNMGPSVKLILQDASNSNSNFARVTDISNNFIVEKTKTVKTEIWTRTEEVNLGSGKDQQLKMLIPYNFAINKVHVVTEQSLSAADVWVGARSRYGDIDMMKINSSVGEQKKAVGMDAMETNRYLYLKSVNNFNNKGKVSVTVELIRITE
ncbi:hypothetical protein [Euzebyella saccharophila]|uniref:Uncharacterized protein n=1 Tax=Euzebyella saccharophila TaxID=679664 RepID=A0ABV8JSW5_9FLAO|nr:hypothetical protein [Euzebyella saccharophila]